MADEACHNFYYANSIKTIVSVSILHQNLLNAICQAEEMQDQDLGIEQFTPCTIGLTLIYIFTLIYFFCDLGDRGRGSIVI